MSSEWKDGVTSVQSKQGEEFEQPTPKEPRGNIPPPQTKWIRNDGLPVFWAFAVLLATALAVTGFKWAGRTPPEQIELFANIAMFAVAAKGFFALGQPSTLSSRRLSSTLGNLTVSALAFFMNVKIFGYTIRWNCVPDDLWSQHAGWIICSVVQVLFLSGFAQYMRRQALRLPGLGKAVGRQVKNVASALVRAVKQSDKGVLLIFLTGAVLWGTYLGSQISSRGAQSVFSDVEILWESVLLLLVWTMVGILLYVAPAVCKKFKWAIFGVDGKRIIIAVGIATAVMLAVLVFALLTLLGGVRATLTMLVALAVLVGLICAAVKCSVEKSLRLNSPRKGERNGGILYQDSTNQSHPGQNA